MKPMLAASKTPALEDIQYPVLASPKLDGIRCLIINGVACSRNLKPIPNLFVQKELAKYHIDGLDGELMVEGDFNAVQSSIMSIHGEPDFYLNVFDKFDYGGIFVDRLAAASHMVVQARAPERLRMVEHYSIRTPEELMKKWELWIKEGYEGGMVRAVQGPYKHGRSTPKQGYLIKLKKWHDDEALVIGLEEGKSNQNEATTGNLGQTERSSEASGMVLSGTLGSLRVVWNDIKFGIGTGFDAQQRQEIWDNPEKYVGQKVTFKYQELSKYDVPRFPVFKGFRYE